MEMIFLWEGFERPIYYGFKPVIYDSKSRSFFWLYTILEWLFSNMVHTVLMKKLVKY